MTFQQFNAIINSPAGLTLIVGSLTLLAAWMFPSMMEWILGIGAFSTMIACFVGYATEELRTGKKKRESNVKAHS